MCKDLVSFSFLHMKLFKNNINNNWHKGGVEVSNENLSVLYYFNDGKVHYDSTSHLKKYIKSKLLLLLKTQKVR